MENRVKVKRVFLIVLDSFGIGEAEDAAEFGDVGAHTLRSIWNTGRLKIDNLRLLGLGNIDGLSFVGQTEHPLGAFARMKEASAGKDTTIGHWEISGHISKTPLPTFPNGFDVEIIDRIKRISGRDVLCNKPYSGTAVIRDFGAESVQSGSLIIYTSADSVLQIAAHIDVVPLDELYRVCSLLRAELVGEKDGVGRIIARPFSGNAKDGFVRTPDRRDYSIEPPVMLLPERVKENGLSSIAIGKISDIFAGKGFTESCLTHGNREGMERALEYIRKDFEGLCFVNLVDFDMLYGHRRDADGYAEAISEFDLWLGKAIDELRDGDVMMITADHGCDPSFLKTTDHTRENTPLIVYGKNVSSMQYGVRSSFADIAATVASLLGVELECDGETINLSFKDGENL